MKQKNWRPREEEKLPTWIKLAVQQERKRRGGDEQEDKRTSYEGFVALYERSLPINGLQRKQEWENFDQMGKVGRCLYGHHHKLPTLLILNSLKHQKQQIFLKYFLKECQLYQNYYKKKIDNGMVSGFGVISIGLIGMAMVFNGSQPLAKQWIGIVQGYIQLFSCFLWANTSMSYEDVGDKCFCITCYVEVCLDGGQQILLSLAPPAYTAGT